LKGDLFRQFECGSLPALIGKKWANGKGWLIYLDEEFNFRQNQLVVD